MSDIAWRHFSQYWSSFLDHHKQTELQYWLELADWLVETYQYDNNDVNKTFCLQICTIKKNTFEFPAKIFPCCHQWNLKFIKNYLKTKLQMCLYLNYSFRLARPYRKQRQIECCNDVTEMSTLKALFTQNLIGIDKQRFLYEN